MAARERRRFRPQCEQLERRELPAVRLTAGAWVITGDANARNLADNIIVRPNPRNAASLQVVINQRVADTRPAWAVRSINILSGRGNDTVRVNLPESLKRIAVRVDGGAGDDLLVGGDGNDVLVGGPGADRAYGQGGGDRLLGGDGDDVLAGGSGDDQLLGERGADYLRGGTGRNTLTGGDGLDRLYTRRAFDRIAGDVRDRVWEDAPPNPLRPLDSLTDSRNWLLEAAAKHWATVFGKKVSGPFQRELDGPLGLPVLTTTEMAPRGGAGDFSGTNTQVAGVDEADLVKTDGRFLYLTSGQELVILAAGDPEAGTPPTVVSRTAIEGSPAGLYLSGDRLIVLSHVHGSSETDSIRAMTAGVAIWPGRYYRTQVKVAVLDVSDRAAPRAVEQSYLDGSLVSSRSVGGRVYVVLQNSWWMPSPDVVRVAAGWRYETLAEYRARVTRLPADQLLPDYRTAVPGADGRHGSLLAPGSLYVPEHTQGTSALSVVLFDVSNAAPGPDAITSALGVGNHVYASAESLYVASTSWAVAEEDGDWTGQAQTDVIQFGLGVDRIDLRATGSVPGWVLNQFAMDESAGYFRIATTVEGRESSNNLFVLRADGGTFTVTGSLTGLAPTERIYSARFLGDRAYLVTFRQVDPLLSIDLSDPARPRVVGELKIPGFSSYLHPVGATHLIGLGRDADPETGRTQGLQLSLFDVADPANPRRVGQHLFAGDPWSSHTEAEWDHHAFSYFADRGILALPVDTGGWWQGKSGLAVFRVDVAAGFTLLGEVEHDSAVRRSLRIGEMLFSLSDTTLKVTRLDDPAHELASLVLRQPDQHDVFPMPVLTVGEGTARTL